MKVMISTDMEGVSGVVDWDQISPGTTEYQRGRRLLTHDVNAAVQGCVDAGATEIVVVDVHANWVNILYDELHPEAQLVVSGPSAYRPGLQLGTIDESFDLVMLVGYHAAGHYPAGLLAHTFMLPASFWEVRLNGTPVGESEVAAALAASYGVPVGLLSSDDVTVAAVSQVLPEIETVTVKWAIDRTAARCLSLATTGRLIREAAVRAVERSARGDFKPWHLEPPYRMEFDCGHAGLAQKLAAVPDTERVGDRTVAIEGPSYPEVYERFIVLFNLATTARDPRGGA